MILPLDPLRIIEPQQSDIHRDLILRHDEIPPLSRRQVPDSVPGLSRHVRTRSASRFEALRPPQKPDRDIPSADLESDKRALLQVVLVDASNGIVRALRTVSWSPEFTRSMHAAIRRQAEAHWDESAYDAALAALYGRYRSSDALAAAADAQTNGGE